MHPRSVAAELLALRSDAAAFTLKVRAFHLYLLGRKAGYRPDQARVPAGDPDGGQWVQEDGSSADELPLVPISHTDGGLPKIPDDPPPTVREKNSFAVAAARALYVSIRLSPPTWLLEYAGYRIRAFLEPARTLDALKEAALDPKPGYEIHHIVEQTPARRDGISEEKIEGYDNRVRVPTYRHWEITRWYATGNKNYGGLSPREFLRGQRWEMRYSVGLDALRIHGVLLP